MSDDLLASARALANAYSGRRMGDLLDELIAKIERLRMVRDAALTRAERAEAERDALRGVVEAVREEAEKWANSDQPINMKAPPWRDMHPKKPKKA